jgi:hypothetical protein
MGNNWYPAQTHLKTNHMFAAAKHNYDIIYSRKAH